MPTRRGLAPRSELIPAWCSTASTFRPRSSQSRNSSMTSSKRSAATVGSQKRLGRLARTESVALITSCGTNGYGTSHCHQASIVHSLPEAASASEELHDRVDESRGLLDLGTVSGALDQLETRLGNQRAVCPPVGRLHDAVAGTPHDERGYGDAGEPTFELRVVHVRVPAVEAERLPAAGADHELLVRERIEIRRPALGIVPAPPLHFLRRGVEDVQDVRCLAIAHLDAERVDEYQPVEPVATLHGELGGEPAAEREAHQGRLLVRQALEEFEIEMDE